VSEMSRSRSGERRWRCERRALLRAAHTSAD
jgi:hypothetical protein